MDDRGGKSMDDQDDLFINIFFYVWMSTTD